MVEGARYLDVKPIEHDWYAFFNPQKLTKHGINYTYPGLSFYTDPYLGDVEDHIPMLQPGKKAFFTRPARFVRATTSCFKAKLWVGAKALGRNSFDVTLKFANNNAGIRLTGPTPLTSLTRPTTQGGRYG